MMSDDELEEAWQSFATPQAKLMREADEFAASGDLEILAARAAYVAAWRHYRSLDGMYEAAKAIQDVS